MRRRRHPTPAERAGSAGRSRDCHRGIAERRSPSHPEQASSPGRAPFYYRAIVASNHMRIGRFCIDWKVVAGLAAVAVGIWLVQPRLFISALPVLLVAACPLSMVLMMWGMRSMGQSAPPAVAAPQQQAERQLTPNEQLARLRGQLSELQSAQLTIAEQIRSLQAAMDPEPTGPELAPQRLA